MASEIRIWCALLEQLQCLRQEQRALWCEFSAVQRLLQSVMRACWQYTMPVIIQKAKPYPLVKAH